MKRRGMQAAQSARRFWSDQSGNTAVEYAILVVMLAGALLPVLQKVHAGLLTTLAAVAATSFGGQMP
jgi:Flp pilus assembly pilin Flp